MDTISLNGIAFFGHHGHTAEEQAAGGRYSVDVQLALDLTKPSQTDRLEDTLDYRRANELVKQIGQTRRFHLVEGLAGAIADALLKEFPQVQEIRITVRKYDPRMPGAIDHVSATLTRSRL